MNVYQENGYESRKHYLQCLAEDYDLDYKDVVMLATTLGESEDFDGLVVTLLWKIIVRDGIDLYYKGETK